MNRKTTFELSKSARYVPYTKTSQERYIVRINPRSGHISINERIYREWIHPKERVDLYYNRVKKLIGIRPAWRKGLKLIKVKNGKSYYFSAIGFLKSFDIRLDQNKKVKSIKYDPQNKVIIVPL